jgi:hypothetical protein
MSDPEWNADFQTGDLTAFLTMARESRSCFLFVDEAGMNCGQWDKDSLWLGTQSRHWGHSCFFITQRAQMLSPTIRGQCRFLYLFNCSKTDSKLLSDEWNKPELESANSLKQGEYLYCSKFSEVQRYQLF